MLWRAEKTLTVRASDATATTYEKICPTGTVTTTSSPSPTPSSYDPWYDMNQSERSAYDASFLSRVLQEDSTALYEAMPTGEYAKCIPFTLIQGPETWGFHLTVAESGLWTKNGDCSWTGAFTTASITCSIDVAGTAIWSSPLTEISVFGRDELRNSTMFAIATVVTATATGDSAVTTTAGGAAAPRSTGGGFSAPVPTGAMVMAGGAGVFAAAMAL
ncbi:hypothetical protein ACN47E_008942 [Coniothyrium glycines]